MTILKKRLLSTQHAAVYIDMSEEYLRRARIKGTSGSGAIAPKFIKIGRSVKYPLEELDSFIDSFTRYDHLAQIVNPT